MGKRDYLQKSDLTLLLQGQLQWFVAGIETHPAAGCWLGWPLQGPWLKG
ncbi:hypothetical protein A2U01_0018772 [Trifolium medium]|uniref:Uncharacterized protein n=1 Tax=Trifolium medium TaxID=97028 RepID=A0A392ND35_9FABA|nr:hypothetical protein [Trifolium medium]